MENLQNCVDIKRITLNLLKLSFKYEESYYNSNRVSSKELYENIT